MINQDYGLEIEKTIHELQRFGFKLQGCMLNLMMHGNLNEWKEDENEQKDMLIENSLFEASEDQNIQELLRLHAEVEKIKERLKRIS